MKNFFKGILYLFPLLSFGQVDLKLKNELDSMYVLDQRYRGYFSRLSDSPALADSLKKAFKVTENLSGYLWTRQSEIDKSNFNRLEQIIQQHGYPGTNLVGKTTNEVAFYIIQHSPKIEAYFPVVKAAAEKDQLPFYLSGMMEDRLLTRQLKPQIYGSQVVCYPLRDTPEKRECFVWPVEDPQSVDDRRLKAGFSQSIEANSKRLGVDFKPMTIEEVRRRYRLTPN